MTHLHLFKYVGILLFTSVTISASAQLPVSANSNVKYQDAQVRITLVTDGVVRLEWHPDGRFTDNASFVAVNRKTPEVVDVKVNKTKKYVQITTPKMRIKYLIGSGKFTANNLSITSPKGMLAYNWKPGTANNGNLKGTYRTLDGYDGNIHIDDNKPMHIEDGLLSTDGWTLIDDSKNYLFDNADWAWVTERTDTLGQDWYFMAYGHNYKQALNDYTVFAGKVPLPPRYAFGYWWSRYWTYSDNEFRALINNFHKYDIPLDVLVIDMDWHYVEQGKGGWTGYTWNKRLFPDPDGFLKYLKQNNLKTTLNLHPADGVASYEDKFPALAKYMGVDTTAVKVIQYEGSNKKFMSGWLKTIIHPLMKQGMDFAWLDWQQQPNDSKLKDLSNTWWINYAVFSDMQRTDSVRPMLYHRWGGLGNHRYQIGFSGDSKISWASLDFQPYFTTTASNVLYGYWSNDIGGHMGAGSIDPELETRWLQYGAFSPILRTHSTENAGLNKEPWAFSHDYTEIMRNTIIQRYQLAPYIYTMARETYDNGISICHPMYYDYPESKEAYDNKNEYMFGDNILICPITKPMVSGKSTVKVWLPAGNNWYEWATGTLLNGGQTVERTFHIDEYPIYVKAGSVLPMYGKDVRNLQNNDEPVEITIFPGGTGKFTMYEDNGNDVADSYHTQYATTSFFTDSNNEGALLISIGARRGAYPGMPVQRKFKVKVLASAVPSSVSVNGQPAKFTYNGNELALIIDVPETDCSVAKIITIDYPEKTHIVSDGLYGQFHHVQQAVLGLKQRNAGIWLTEELGTMESTGRAITYYPAEFNDRINKFRTNFSNLPSILANPKLLLDKQTQDWFLEYVK